MARAPSQRIARVTSPTGELDRHALQLEALQLEDANRLVAALDRHGTTVPHLHAPGQHRERGFGDEDRRAQLLVEPLDPRADVHGVAYDGVLRPRATAHVAGEHLPGVDSDAHP